MDKFLNKVDSILIKNNKIPICYLNDIPLNVIVNAYQPDVSKVTFKSEKNETLLHLFNSICDRTDLTPDIVITILKQIVKDIHELPCVRCHVITQEFCETYKNELPFNAKFMLTNYLPIDYIINTYPDYLFDSIDLWIFSKYCTYDEYIKYCRPRNISPCLENKNMTIDWYIDNNILMYIDRNNCITIRPDLFTIDVIMKYKYHVGNVSKIWVTYFNKLPLDFIAVNIDIKYCDFNDIISVFKMHPCSISWYIIDKYIEYHMPNRKIYNAYITIPDTVQDMPKWFVLKYLDNIIDLDIQNVNAYINYKFICEKNIKLNLHTSIQQCRALYINLIKDIIDICNDNNINEDLHAYILDYS